MLLTHMLEIQRKKREATRQQIADDDALGRKNGTYSDSNASLFELRSCIMLEVRRQKESLRVTTPRLARCARASVLEPLRMEALSLATVAPSSASRPHRAGL